MPHKEIPEDIQLLLKTVVEHFDDEDRAVRERQIREWRRLKLYWDGFQRIWYSETAHDWRIFDAQGEVENQNSSYYDKPVNVFRAYLESIIAALSVTVPALKCYPDDAEDNLDLSTAKAGDKIADLISKHNNVDLLWLHALYIYCTEGMIACYNYTREDKEYGTYSENKYEDEEVPSYKCVGCGEEIDAKAFTDNPDISMGPVCPECGEVSDPLMRPDSKIVSKLVGVTEHPKSRQIMEVYGGLYVKIANYAQKQEDTPYLIFSYETHYANIIERYSHLKDKFDGSSKIGAGSGGVYDPYERWGRLSPQYHGEYPINTATIRNCWLRPASFNVLDDGDMKKLRKLYPDGVKVVFANDEFCHAEAERLDDHWTLTNNPLSDHLHHDPLGLLLTSIQDITNDIVSLVLQTIEQGIPQTFADPQVLDFNKYSQTEVAPGSIFPAKPLPGRSIGDGFYEVKTANLSGEVLPFSERIQQFAQLTSGAMPSLFGGSSGGSKTASEYSMSRAQSLQRLQTTWKMLTSWWKEIYGKVIPAYIEDVMEDERFVEKTKEGNFVNVFIRKAELQGKIGNIEILASEQLPVTWVQKKDVVMELMQMNNPLVMQALTAPENLTFISEALGLNQFVMPGEDDRNKQFEEIKNLLTSEPMEDVQADPMTGMEMPIETPSVDIDPIIDNHQIEFIICRNWLVSDAGRLAKTDNPLGYRNVLLHMQAHMQVMMQQQAEAAAAAAGAEQSNGGKETKAAPESGVESNGSGDNLPIQ